ncbi:MAG: carbohydrate-binding family 9-like protein [Planctomycetota bacterium]|nr:carbohydrate-binding family 9-like protein [Planctomycetota bacterium]
MDSPKNYLVRRASGTVRLACDDPSWDRADRLAIDEYPWYAGGLKQETTAAVLYDDEAIYLLYVCQDKHISAVETRSNGNVYLDSCVEFFMSFESEGGRKHLNFEVNCCGTIHMGFGAGRENRTLAPPEVLNAVKVQSSIPTPTKNESPTDDGWWLAAAIPFSAISEFVGRRIAPEPGETWRANFYRCGGKTDPQYAAWNPIDCPEPDFHRPEFFGTITFE